MRKPTAIVPKPNSLPQIPTEERDRVYKAYLDELDPRGNEEVQLALAACPDPRFQRFLECLNMPRYRRMGLQTIAKGCGISLMEYQKWWQRESAQRAIAKAQMGSVIITQDMVEDAKSTKVVCSRCDGLGFVGAPPGLPEDTAGYRCIAEATEKEDSKWVRDCPNCDGVKKLRKPGDQHARDKVMDMAGLVKKGSGITLVQNFGGASHTSAVQDIADATTLDADFEVG